MRPLPLTLLLLATLAGARPLPADREFATRLAPELAPLGVLIGEWSIEGRLLSGPGEPWVKVAGDATFDVRLGGKVLREVYRLDGAGTHWGVECQRTWDPFQEVFRVVYLDDQWGLCDVYEGDWDAVSDSFVVSNERANTWYELGGVRHHTRARVFDVAPMSFRVEWTTRPAGAERWFATGHLTYRRTDSEKDD